MPTAVQAHYTPRGACADAISSRDPEVLVAGPAGTGKSLACLWKVHMTALSNPGCRCLIVRKTQVSLTNTALVTWKEQVIPTAEEAGVVDYYGGSRAESAAYRYNNGARVELAGMDKPDKVMSSEYDLIYINEATELVEEDWEKLTTRLRHDVVSYQQILGDCNPDRPEHWLKKRCDRGVTTMFVSTHEDNPTLFDDDGQLTPKGSVYIARLDGLTGTRYQRLRLGNWVGAEGAIYPEYESGKHLVDPFPVPWEWNRYWSVDFGFVNPMVVQQWAEHPDGDLILYREFYATRRLVTEMAEEVLSVVADPDGEWIEPRPVSIFADHDAEGREQFARAIGQSTVPAMKAVSEGIQAVQARLKGEPGLRFFRDAVHSVDPYLVEQSKPTCTVEELPGYVWADNKTKEQPVKIDDHGADGLRYLVAGRDLGARPGVRWL